MYVWSDLHCGHLPILFTASSKPFDFFAVVEAAEEDDCDAVEEEDDEAAEEGCEAELLPSTFAIAALTCFLR